MATAEENTTKAQFLHMSGTTATTVPGDWPSKSTLRIGNSTSGASSQPCDCLHSGHSRFLCQRLRIHSLTRPLYSAIEMLHIEQMNGLSD